MCMFWLQTCDVDFLSRRVRPQLLQLKASMFTETLISWQMKWVWCSQVVSLAPPWRTQHVTCSRQVVSKNRSSKMSKQHCRWCSPLRCSSIRGQPRNAWSSSHWPGHWKEDDLVWLLKPAEHESHLRITLINICEPLLGCSPPFESTGLGSGASGICACMCVCVCVCVYSQGSPEKWTNRGWYIYK